MAADRLTRLRRALAKAGNRERAKAQQAYMKSTMPYYGVSNDEMRAIAKKVFEDYGFDDPARWRLDVLEIWRNAQKREERYAAIELLQHKKARSFHTLEALPMLEEMIVTGAWWDYVDTIAARDVGAVLKSDPKTMRRRMIAWSTDKDIWKRRTSILCQLRFKETTDLALLYACIEPSIERTEFWLRKAIGWALRELAKTNPDEVRRYVAENEERLSGLSRREALKNLGPITSSPSRGGARRTREDGPRTRPPKRRA